MVKNIVIIDSKDKNINSNSTSDFYITTLKFNDVIKIKILEIQIPISWYNIRSGQQNIYVNSTLYTIPSASYTASTLLTELQTLLTSYTVTYNSATLKYTIAATGNFTLNCSQWDIGMLNILGFNNQDLTGTNSYTSQNMIILNPDTKLTLHSSLGQQTLNTIMYSDNRTSILLDIPIFSALNSYQFFQPINPIEFYLKQKINLTKIDFQLKDKQQQIIDLNGIDIILKLEVTTEG